MSVITACGIDGTIGWIIDENLEQDNAWWEFKTKKFTSSTDTDEYIWHGYNSISCKSL